MWVLSNDHLHYPPPIMSVEEFVNKKLSPAGVVTIWEETLMTTAYQLSDLPKLLETIFDLCEKANMEMPENLTLH